VKIRTGITDHTVTEVVQVLNGQVNEGDQLVTGAISQTSSASSARPPGAASPATPRGR
jgi:L-cysteine desulfidase